MKHRVFLIAAALCAAVACLSITGCGEDDAAPNRADTVKTSERMPQTYFEGAEILEQEIDSLYRLLARSEQGTNDTDLSHEHLLSMTLTSRAVVKAMIGVHERTGDVPKESLEKVRRRLADLDGANDLLKDRMAKEGCRLRTGGSPGSHPHSGRDLQRSGHVRFLRRHDPVQTK